jgi:hypothetical protein
VVGKTQLDLGFMEQIRDWFLSQQSNQFLVTGNVLDVLRCPWLSREEQLSDANYVSLPDYLTTRLSMKQRVIITFNIARGLTFADDASHDIARRIYLSRFEPEDVEDAEERFNDVVARSASWTFPALVLLRKLCEASSQPPRPKGASIAVIIEHAESLLPNLPIARMGDTDRQRLVFFKEWLTERGFVMSDHLLVLVSETASAVNESLRSLPHLVTINIPLPEEDERRRFIQWCLRRNPGLQLVGTQKEFARISAGMTLMGIEQTIRLAQYRRGKLTRADFVACLKRLLVSRIGDHVELVEPQHTLADVLGNAALKSQLKRITTALDQGDPGTAPVGILMTGPNGVGKTFIALAWARESGRTALILRNLRSSFFGETDQIFEKIRQVLEVLGNVMILVDEADTVFARPGANVHETEQRLFGNVIQMMGDPQNRSRILWVLMTARPDNLAPDLKRSGRCGLHLPVFDPEDSDRRQFVEDLLARNGASIDEMPTEGLTEFEDRTRDYSAADFRELAAELKTEELALGHPLAPDEILGVVRDMLPAEGGPERRMQTLQAFMHCSRKSLVPKSLRHLDRETVARQVATMQGHTDDGG